MAKPAGQQLDLAAVERPAAVHVDLREEGPEAGLENRVNRVTKCGGQQSGTHSEGVDELGGLTL